jgi:hypothetical protein
LCLSERFVYYLRYLLTFQPIKFITPCPLQMRNNYCNKFNKTANKQKFHTKVTEKIKIRRYKNQFVKKFIEELFFLGKRDI